MSYVASEKNRITNKYARGSDKLLTIYFYFFPDMGNGCTSKYTSSYLSVFSPKNLSRLELIKSTECICP